MTNQKKHLKLSLWFLIAVQLIIAIIALQFLPESIPIHWNSAGIIDGFANKFFIFLGPGFSILIVLLMNYMPKFDPKMSNYPKFETPYIVIQFILVILFFGIEIITILTTTTDITINMATIMPVLIGGMFIVIGNFLPKIKQSYFVGIKTPWTLASENNWFKTHRFAGRLWVLGGVLLMCMPFLPSTITTVLFFVFVFVMAIVPFIYSYVLFKNESKHQ